MPEKSQRHIPVSRKVTLTLILPGPFQSGNSNHQRPVKLKTSEAVDAVVLRALF
jgi:hypothetical protein